MSGSLAILLGILFVLGVITVVGHLLWLMLAALFGAGANRPPSPPQRKSLTHCPWCDGLLAERAAHCAECGWPTEQDAARRADAAALALRKKVSHLEYLGLIDSQQATRLKDVLREEITTAKGVPLSETLPASIPPSAADESIELVEAELADGTFTIAPPPMPTAGEPATVGEVNRSIQQRSEAYSARRSEAVAPIEPRAPSPPRKPFSEMLIGFLEEKNIRWGELIGGLLIVGSSIALVLSFWSAIAQRPLLKFGLFNGVTAGLFGLGHYIHRHWKLANTSQGLLLTATLLAPLNFLAITAFTQDTVGPDTLTLVGELASMAVFAVLVYLTGRVVTPGLELPLTIAVLGCATSQFLIRRVTTPELSELRFVGLGLLPALLYAVPLSIALWRRPQANELDADTMAARCKLLGCASFAVLLAMGLLAVRSGMATGSLGRLAPLLPLLGWPSLMTGLVAWRRMTDDSLAGWRTAGTAIAVLGAMVTLGALVLAWSDPATMVTVALVNFVLLSIAAWRFDLPAGHCLAAGALACAYLMAVPVLRGLAGWRMDDARAVLAALWETGNGAALTPLAAVLGAAAGVWARLRRTDEARSYGLVAGIVAVISLGLVTCRGLGAAADGGATFVYPFYGVGAIAAAFVMRRKELTWAGAALLLTTLIQALVYRFADVLRLADPWLMALLIHALLIIATATFVRRWETWRESVARPLGYAAQLSAGAGAATLAVLVYRADHTAEVMWYPLALATVWGIGALVECDLGQFALFQTALAAFVMLLTSTLLERETWYQTAGWPKFDPWTLQSHGIALALLGSLWAGVRLLARRHALADAPWRSMIAPARLTVDRVFNAAVLVATALLSVYAAWPGVWYEVCEASPSISVDTFAWPELPWRHAHGLGAWLLWGAGLLLLVLRLVEGYRAWLVLAVVGIVWLICPLASAECTGFTASALRWTCGGFLVVAACLHAKRDRWLSWTARWDWPVDELRSPAAVQTGRATSLALGGFPIIVLSSWLIGMSLVNVSPRGPEPGTFFAQIGDHASYLVPLSALVAYLVSVAIGDRLAWHGLSAGLVLHLMATLAYLRWPLRLAGRDELLQWFELAQVNTLAGGVYTLVWFAWLRRYRWAQDTPSQRNAPFLLQQALSILSLVLFIVPAGLILWVDPTPRTALLTGAEALAWLSLIASAVGWILPQLVLTGRLSIGRATWCGVAAGVLLGFTACHWGTTIWLGYHLWQVSLVVLAASLLLTTRAWHIDRSRHWALAVSVVWLLIVATGLRAVFGDPQEPWWAVFGLGSASLLSAVLAAWLQSRWRVVPAALLLNLAGTLIFVHYRITEGNVAMLNLLLLTLPCVAWVWLDRRWILGDQPQRARGVGWHRIAPVISLAILALLAAGALGFPGLSQRAPPSLVWLAWGGTVVAIVASVWDPYTRLAPLSLYIAGLTAVGLGLLQLIDRVSTRAEQDRLLLWAGVSFLAAYAIGASYLWSRRRELRGFLARLGVPVRTDESLRELYWLVPANSLLVLGVLGGATVIDLTFAELGWRLAAGKAALLQMVSLGLLSRGERRSWLQRGTLVVGVLGGIIWGWAWLPPSVELFQLDRIVVAIIAVVAAIAIYGLALTKILRHDNDWTLAAQSITPALAVLIVVGVTVVLGVEIQQQLDLGRVIIASWASLAMIGVFLGLAMIALAAALVPGRDPLQLSERGRTVYVYAAEAFLGLLFLHVRLAMPELFTGFLSQFWPLIVMAIAFVGVGLSEVFRRQSRLVLYEPLERTGALLPLLPVLGFWVAGSQVHYSWVMVVVGALYGVLAILRKSFGYSMLAALAANGGLWYLLGRVDGFGLVQHPQLWLIPPAACVLVAAQLNRAKLTAGQLTTVRYLTSTVIYISSTADIFLRGVAQAPWLPLVLGALSLLGVLLGIVLRVRAFLYLGTTFLAIALATIIKYAAVDLEQTWLWAVSGIVTGVAIIALFAVFEKKRNDILRLVEQLKGWEA